MRGVSSEGWPLPDWERLLAAERHLQHLVPGTILVGETATAIHAGHRVSMDGDHVMEDLRERFDEVLEAPRVGRRMADRSHPAARPGRADGRRLWLAALASLGEDVDLAAEVPDFYSTTTV
jgi:hypothetical protein